MSEKWDEKVIELAKSLINCQSYSGHEEKAAEALKTYMKEAGVFDEIETDCYGNVIGHIKGKMIHFMQLLKMESFMAEELLI